MFKGTKAFGGFAVKDSDQSLTFYRDVLGVNVVQNKQMGNILTLSFQDGGTIIAYPKPDHQPATFTVLNFNVADVATAVQDLKTKGVKFESYDMPGFKTDDDNIFRGGGPLIAWFTDPSGNIMSVIQE
ncbi:VOC family protein [Mucilaginibacter ginkgonis]|uniref:VOC family protein n=1 Tax=Mucilaginibacter ginkgonis TaxID=2682091 RepID=A0A6I4I3M0_9SPHI|nr:VOC family protein [Mucilaginibacter ginkgonis]QQL49178.1 VOC family protein [Mucilaginibacter ginkgonis]